mgnify:FL=1
MVESAWLAAARLAYQLAAEILARAGREITDHAKLKDATAKYCENYKDRWCKVKPIGLDQPIDLADVYVPVKFADRSYLRRKLTPGQYASQFGERRGGLSYIDHDERTDGLKLAQSTQYLNVLGQPGAGKSTFLRRLGLAALDPTEKSRFGRDLLPVYIELRSLGGIPRKTVLDALAHEFSIAGFFEARRFVQDAMACGKLLVLLDGLDEVSPAILRRIVVEISDLVDQYPRNRYVTSCRTKFYEGDFHRFKDAVVLDFNEDQVKKFITNWFAREDCEFKTAEKLIQLLEDQGNRSTLELAHTPLLLNFICVVYSENQDLPRHIASLYRDALDIYLRKWAAHKRLSHPERQPRMSVELELQMLSEIASVLFKDDAIAFERVRIIELMKSFFDRQVDYGKSLSADDVLQEIEVFQGILVQRASDVFTFAHLTLQEYLTAFHLKQHNQIAPIIHQRLTEVRWRQVFLLLASMGPADFLLDQMAVASNSLLSKSQHLRELVAWVNGVVLPTKDPCEFAQRRAVALFGYLNYAAPESLNIRLGHYSSSMMFARLGAEFFDPTGESAIDGSLAFKEGFVRIVHDQGILRLNIHEFSEIDRRQPLRLTALKVFGFSNSDSNWHKEDQLALRDFLIAWNLILDCKNAAVSVTKNAWRRVSTRFLSND